MSVDLEPLPQDVRSVLDLGRLGAPPSGEVQARLLRRIAVSSGIALSAGAHGAALPAKAAKASVLASKAFLVATVFTIGAAVGIGADIARRGEPEPPAAPAPIVEIRTRTLAAVVPMPVFIVVAAPPAARAAPKKLEPATTSDLAAESALIERARTALAHGDPDAALIAIAEHARRFSHGTLGEERAAVEIQALVAAGKMGDARARAEVFRAQFPHSLLGPIVEKALSK